MSAADGDARLLVGKLERLSRLGPGEHVGSHGCSFDCVSLKELSTTISRSPVEYRCSSREDAYAKLFSLSGTSVTKYFLLDLDLLKYISSDFFCSDVQDREEINLTQGRD